MSDFRMKRVNEQVRRELSASIRQSLPVETYGVVTVTEVEVSKDLKNAAVYISSVNVGSSNEQLLEALMRIRPMLQSDLSRKVSMKYTPQLLFKLDPGLERGQHVIDLLNQLDDPDGKQKS